jgi:DNA-binding NarL/FixJ family response regulator
MAPTTTIVVADDHPAMVAAVAGMLEQHGFAVVGRAADGEQALAAVREARPDVAVLDVQMPKLSGVEVAHRLVADGSASAVVLYTAFGDRALLGDALDAGARGFVLKEAPLSDLVRAVRLVAAGETYVDPVVAGVLVEGRLVARLPVLTRREREVLRLLADGLANEEIGRRLHISSETVRTHVRKAMTKLEADTRTQAVATALRQAIIS